jgi:hypothetical protein
MDKVRAEILKVDYPLTAAARITVAAPAQKIFEYLADPYAQPVLPDYRVHSTV